MALLDRRLSDSLRQVAFSGTAGAEKQSVLPLPDEGAGGQIEDQAAIHLRVETEVEVIQSSLRIAEGRPFAPPLQQTSRGGPSWSRLSQLECSIDWPSFRPMSDGVVALLEEAL